LPAAQVAAAFEGGMHTLLQAPQFKMSASVGRHVPLHGVKPDAH
jgi:hypothetical protein